MNLLLISCFYLSELFILNVNYKLYNVNLNILIRIQILWIKYDIWTLLWLAKSQKMGVTK